MESGSPKPLLLKGDETILIADDEEDVLEITRRIVERMGYTVICARSTESALKLFIRHNRIIDLVILDLHMPGMGGRKCLEKLMAFKPDSKVLISTGYANMETSSSLSAKGASGIIIKPYSMHALSKVIRDILDA